MDVSTVIQAVIVYMKDHYPTTPEEFNFHAELKAACHWHWLDDTKPHPFMKPVPYDDCRLKIAATETLKTWEEELKALEAECKGMEVEHCDSSDESLEEQLLGGLLVFLHVNVPPKSKLPRPVYKKNIAICKINE